MNATQVKLLVASFGIQPLALRAKELEEQLKHCQTGVMLALKMMLDLKDLKTGLHTARLAERAVRVAEHLGFGNEELRDIEFASLLHDIDRIGVPDGLPPKPSRLTPEERATGRKQLEYGWAILRNVPGSQRTHEERVIRQVASQDGGSTHPDRTASPVSGKSNNEETNGPE